MNDQLILASGSTIRSSLLKNAGVEHATIVPRIDEESIRASMISAGEPARNIADALAEAKARKIALREPEAFVIGCDQVLACNGTIFEKPTDTAAANSQLSMLSNNTHTLYSAAVIYHEGRAVWRKIGKAELTMRDCSAKYLADYVDRNWDDIRHCVGCYMLEAEGARLFRKVEGDYFTVLGLPLVDILGYLTDRGVLPG